MTKEHELITAQELEFHAVQQKVSEMTIVETELGFELHAPLRSWLSDHTITRDGQMVIALTDPKWRVLRTRRAQEPRQFKNLVTVFAYIEEKFPSVREVKVEIRQDKPRAPLNLNAVAGKSSGNKAPKRTTKRAKTKT